MERRAIFGNKVVQSGHDAIRAMLKNNGRTTGNTNFKAVFARLFIGDGEEQQRHITPGFPVAFHRRHFLRLVLKRIQPVEITH